MPTYVYQCGNFHLFEHYLPLALHQSTMPCDCGLTGEQIITIPAMVKVAQDVCYDSPIDGTPITSWAAREEDLKRNHCRPYDPMMQQDAERFRNESQAKLEQSMDETVARTITKMDTATRGKLWSDLTEKHLTAEPVRLSA